MRSTVEPRVHGNPRSAPTTGRKVEILSEDAGIIHRSHSRRPVAAARVVGEALTPDDGPRFPHRCSVEYRDHGQLAQTPATRVWDVTAKNRPHGRLFLYAGTVTALDPTTSAIAVNVNFGNWRGLYSLLGQPTTETFHYDATTTFVKWAAKQPYTVPVTELHVGDPITVRILAPSWDTPLATLLATPAYRIRIGEPRAAVLGAAQSDPGITS